MHRNTAVTGGASGLGRVIADRLLQAGHDVVLVDHDGEAASATAGQLGSEHDTRVPVLVADLSTVDGVRAAAGGLDDHGIGALVNNAGGWLPGPQYPDAEPATWLSAVTLNLLAPMLLTQALWPRLAAVSGAVVTVGSSGGVGDEPYGSPEYGAAKAGVRRFTTSLGARDDVRVMAVVPGWIGLDRAQARWGAMSDDERQRAGPLIPPEDVAGAVLSLLEHGRPGQVVEMLPGRP